MLSKIKYFILILLWMITTSAMSLSPQTIQLFGLINQRFMVMKSVALYKFRNDIQVKIALHDREILKQVLLYADAIGLDPKTVGPYLMLQMQTSQQVQQAWINTWRAADPDQLPEMSSDDAKMLQSQLSVQNVITYDKKIMDAIMAALPELTEPNNEKNIQALAVSSIHANFVSQATKMALANALITVRKKAVVNNGAN